MVAAAISVATSWLEGNGKKQWRLNRYTVTFSSNPLKTQRKVCSESVAVSVCVALRKISYWLLALAQTLIQDLRDALLRCYNPHKWRVRALRRRTLANDAARVDTLRPSARRPSERPNIQLSKIDTTSRLPLGARLESTRPRKVPSAPSLIPESHRDRRESIECCHFDVGLLSVCCRFDSTFMGG